MDELDIEDYKLIGDLINITSSIKSLYDKLFILESKGKKNSDEYNKILDYLKISIEVENKIYNQLNISNAENIFNYLIKSENDKEIIKRIINNINTQFIFDEDFIIEMLPEKTFEKLQRLKDDKTKIKLRQLTSIIVDIYNCLKNEIANASLVFLQQYLELERYSDIKDWLIKQKYGLIFANKELESNMLCNNFTIPNNVSVISNLIAHFGLINDEQFKFIKESIILNKIIDEFYKILSGDELILFNGNIKVYGIIKQCILFIVG